MARGILPFKRGLIYPGGNPGFDPSHVASAGMAAGHALSAIACANGLMVNLLNGAPGINGNSGTATGIIDSFMGPSTVFGFPGVAREINFVAPNVSDSLETIASIFSWSGQASQVTIFNAGNGGSQNVALYLTAAGLLSAYSTGAHSSTLSVVANVPYFAAASFKNGQAGPVVLKRLDTGAIFTDTIADIGPMSANSGGKYLVGNDGFGNQFYGKIVAVMYAPTFMVLPDLVKWADDPWAFWYPRSLDVLDFVRPQSDVLMAQGWM